MSKNEVLAHAILTAIKEYWEIGDFENELDRGAIFEKADDDEVIHSIKEVLDASESS